jgi:hypothetical protein
MENKAKQWAKFWADGRKDAAIDWAYYMATPHEKVELLCLIGMAGPTALREFRAGYDKRKVENNYDTIVRNQRRAEGRAPLA